MKTTNSIFKKGILFIFFILICQLSFAQQNITDSMLKKEVRDIYNPLQKITALQPKTFMYRVGDFPHLGLPKHRQYGFLSENVQTVFPELMTAKTHQYLWGKNSYRTATVSEVDMQKMIPILVASIIEQQEQIDNLKEEIKHLRNKVHSASSYK